MQVCCNRCATLYNDPDTDAGYDPALPDLERMDFTDSQSGRRERNDCCPECGTDECLMDVEQDQR